MLDPKPPAVVQTNRLPLLAAVIILIVLIGVFMYKTQINHKMPMAAVKPRASIDISTRAYEAKWFNDEKFRHIKINTALHQPTASQITAKIISNQELDLKKREIEDEYSTELEIKKLEDKNTIEEKKLELQAGLSSLNIDVPSQPGVLGKPQEKPIRQGGMSEQLNEIMNMVSSVTGARVPVSSLTAGSLGTNTGHEDAKEAFWNKAGGDDDYLPYSKKQPHSAYEVKAGSYIPAALITGINSDLPGSVNAQVTENVYDSTSGNYLLIPQGARLVGEYNSNLSFGQQRVQVVWNRVIFPDGKSLDLDRMQGADIAGYTGFYDKVNNHYLRIYGNALLLSMMGAGYDILNQGSQQAEQMESPRAIIAANVGQKLSDVSSQALEKNMNVQPTLIIDPGYKFKIFVMKDMVLEPIDDAQGTLSYAK